ncbi:AraC family transcriptional regulator [Williamsia sp.]|uniref:AraC family transcriptional regulator n=1 Tax=Williamsia sp. TaxID=1872085 RepID=UPI001A22F3B5|nr:AraC family transcriptional regulator [Williamsia sp.]MBJ7289984.1 AraC family transcriptional regulator [Williamsia sp.]
MDALSGLLDGPRAHTPFLLRVVMESPWAIEVRDEAPLTVVVMVAGDTHITYDDGARFHADAGDVVILRGPDPYVFADAEGTDLTAVIHPDGVCRSEFGTTLPDHMSLGVRTWGNASPGTDGSAVMLIGTYVAAGEVSSRLLSALDRTIVVPGVHSPLADVLDAEMLRDAPGHETVVNRLLDLILITSLREWFDRPDAAAPRWYTAQSDPVVGHALRLIHNNIALPWSVAGLASAVGVSRAGLSRRFTDLVGDPPMTYVTDWRLSMAADLLADPARTLDSVAREVGYSGAFALSAAFKRSRGVSPREFRRSLSA